MRNLIRHLLGKPVELTPKQQERMARAQAKTDAHVARSHAEMRAAGVQPVESAPSLRDAFKQSVEGFKDAVGESFDDRRGVLDSGGADLNRPFPEIDEPRRRDEIARQERAARDAARAPFAAPQRPAIVFTRFATTGRTQLEDVVAKLRETGLAAHPERVYGVYRVPDRFDHNRNGEGKAYLEWEIAHEPGALAPAAEGVATAGFRRGDPWVRRRPGDPTVVDEELAGTLAARADLRSEDCFGLSRLLHVRGSDNEDAGKSWTPLIDGVLLFTRPLSSVPEAQRGMGEAAPLATLDPAPFHLEILDWEAVAAWVAPHRWGPPRTPSPLPHLPSSWQELLTAYLEVVGVRSSDCYGVQATRTVERSIGDLSLASMRRNFQTPAKVASADGEARARLHVAEHLVLAYRDRPEYRDGRTRWQAYQREVLRARLDHLSGVRVPIVVDQHPRQSLRSEVFDLFDPFGGASIPQLRNRNQGPSLGPYAGRLD